MSVQKYLLQWKKHFPLLIVFLLIGSLKLTAHSDNKISPKPKLSKPANEIDIRDLNEKILLRAMVKSLLVEDECSEYTSQRTFLSNPTNQANSVKIKRAVEKACRRVSTCDADAEQHTTGNNLVTCTDNNGVSDLDMGEQGGANNQVAFSFGNWAIPQGSTILSASIQFTALSTSSGGANFTIYGEDIDDVAPYSTGYDIVSRPLTTASTNWSVPNWTSGDAGSDQQSPDISAIIQEIVDRTGYVEGNSIALHILGTGQRQAVSYDIDPSSAPQLCIEYDTPPEVPEPECADCPSVELVSLDGIPGFPMIDLLNICSAPDTASLLINNPAECSLTDIFMEIDFDDGLFFGGFLFEDPVSAASGSIRVDDLSDVSKPVFYIDMIGPGETMIIDFAVKADCEIDIESEEDINFDANITFGYNGAASTDACMLQITEVGAYNSGIRVPVLNVLDVSPTELDILESSTPQCQTITISQDGIQAFLDEFQFFIKGLDQDLYSLSSIAVNGTTVPPANYTYNAATQTVSLIIDESYFTGNFHTGADGDTMFDGDERLTVEVCYEVNGCIQEANFIMYQALFGCNGLVCGDISEMQGTIDFTPDYGSNATASSSSSTQGRVCGTPMLVDFDITSSNSHPLDGLWEDLVLRWQACDLGISRTSAIIVNGVTMTEGVHYEVVSNTVVLDFANWTSDLDGPGGLSDEDGDGIYDDLPGGQSIDVNVTIDLSCPGDEIPCASNGLTCSITQVDVRGLRNCGQVFQSFADIEDAGFTFGGGETEWTVNNLLYETSERTHVYATPVDDWGAPSPPYDFAYTFNSEGIGTCQNPSEIYLEISTMNPLSKYVRYAPNSATYQGSPVPGATFSYQTAINASTGEIDTLGHTLIIPAGSTTPTLMDEYNWNFEYKGFCGTATDFVYAVRAIEVCDDCAPACETVRACDVMITYVDWRGIDCLCTFESRVDSISRTNFGYADKAMTIPLTAEDVSLIERVRFLPGDTLYYRTRIEVTGTQEQLESANRLWRFDTYFGGLYSAPGIPLHTQAEFGGWFIQDQGTGPLIEIGIPTAMQQYDNNTRDNYYWPSILFINNGLASPGGQWGVDPDRVYCDESQGQLAPEYQDYSVGWYGTNSGCCDDRDNNTTIQFSWGLNEECGEINTSLLTPGLTESEDHYNTVYEDFLREFDVEPGDVFYIEHRVPIVHNPGYDISLLNGQAVDNVNTISTRAFIQGNNPNPNECSIGLNEDCSFPGPDYYTILPNDVNMNNTVTIEDCDVTVEYTFTFPKDVVDDDGNEWFQNEYRPYEFLEYIQPNFPPNFIYQGNAEIELFDGTVIPIPNSYIDTNYGNLGCIDDDTGGLCCMAADSMELAGLRWATPNYYDALNFEYASYTDLGDTTNWISGYSPNGPCLVGKLFNHEKENSGIFPVFIVGGAEDCNTWTLRYKLSPLCPEDVNNTDFSIQAQFAEPALAQYTENTYSANGPEDGCTTRGVSVFDQWDINPYGENPVSLTNDCWNAAWPDHTEDYDRWYFGLVTPDPDASSGSRNPARQTITDVTSVNDFVDNSLNFPPLTADVSNLLLADLAGANEVNVFELCAGTGGGSATHENVVASIEVPNTIDLINIQSLSGTGFTFEIAEIKVSSIVYAIQMANLAPGACDEIQITTELLFCPVGLDVDTEICIQATSGCVEPVKAAALLSNGEVCDVEEVCYQYIAEEADLQVEWDPQPMGPYSLCESFPMGVRMKNVKPAILADIQQDFWFPAGLQFVPNSFQLCYPGGPGNVGPCVSIPDPIANPTENSVFGTNYSYDDMSVLNTFIHNNGLPGILSMQDSNRVQILFDVETICDDFVSGTSVYYQASGADPCESRVNSMFVNSDPIVIEGALPQDFAQFFVIADPLTANCGQDATINLTYLNISPFGETIESTACLNIQTQTFSYNSGSAVWISPPGHTPNVTESPNGMFTEVCFDIPDGIGPGETFRMSMDFAVPEDVDCGAQDLGIMLTTQIEDVTCLTTGEQCSVNVLNSVNPVLSIDFMPGLDVLNHSLASECPDTDGTMDICYEVLLGNNGTLYNDDVTIALYQDLNQNGLIDESFEPLMATEDQAVFIVTGDSITITGCISVIESASCPLVMRIGQSSSCICDATDFPYMQVPPNILDGVEPATVLCPGDTLGLKNCGSWTYTAVPAAGANFTPSAAGDSTFITINSGYGIATPVKILVSSAVGGCEPYEVELDVYGLDEFEFGPYEQKVVCEVGCVPLSLALPSGYEESAIVRWTPDTYLDDPTLLTPTICNPDNNITYRVELEIALGDNRCTFEAQYPVMVMEQVREASVQDADLCPGPTSTMTAPGGYSTYIWQQINDDGTLTTLSYGSSNTYMPTSAGTYQVEYFNLGDICSTLSNPIEVSPCIDYGDLPDSGTGTSSLNYETEMANGGAGHHIVNGLSLGSTVDDEGDGQQDLTAMGDGIDEDGISFPMNTRWVPGGRVRIPFDVFNMTGSQAELEIWIDWNGDGDFDDANEWVIDLSDDASGDFGQDGYLTINIPDDIVLDADLGMRARLGDENNMTPYGVSGSGEVEDYLIRISCDDFNCLPFNISINRE